MSNDEWRTPKWVWEPFAPFDLDVAATAENTLAPKFITREMNALDMDWRDVAPVGSHVWCNPPYSQKAGPLSKWVDTFFFWHSNGFRITALLPSDTSTRWFQEIWDTLTDFQPKLELHFLTPRVRHLDSVTGKPGGSPKFGSLIVEFKL